MTTAAFDCRRRIVTSIEQSSNNKRRTTTTARPKHIEAQTRERADGPLDQMVGISPSRKAERKGNRSSSNSSSKAMVAATSTRMQQTARTTRRVSINKRKFNKSERIRTKQRLRIITEKNAHRRRLHKECDGQILDTY